MALEWFSCPDKELIPVKECLEHCRMERRCLTLPTLLLMAKEREQRMVWKCEHCGEEVRDG